MTEFDYIELIENNPITKLSNAYNNRFLNKIKETFSNFEQKLFISSFYCYLNYDKNIDFIIDLDNIWKWLGFNQKYNAERILEKNFIQEIDYKYIDNKNVEEITKKKKNGGQNKKTIRLTVKCFKSLCLKAQTTKSFEMHEYYMKLEEVLQDVIEEETNELRLQLNQKDIIIQNCKKDKQLEVENAIITQFQLNTECIYFGTIDNTNESAETLIKFGHTNDLSTRVQDHHKKYNNFTLINAFRVQNKVEIENLIKKDPKIKKHIRSIEINGKNKTEIIAYDENNFIIEKLSKCIKNIIQSKTYSIDNFNRIMRENEDFEKENRNIKELLKNNQKIIQEQHSEILNLREKIDIQKTELETIRKNETISVYENIILPVDDQTKKFNEFINTVCIIRLDVEELSTNIEGRYRLWNQVKPTKEVFHALKNYLDTRFKPKRVQGSHGYVGIRLKLQEYKKTNEEKYKNIETFIFSACNFSDTSKILNSVLLREYRQWKCSLQQELTDNDMTEIKDYLNQSQYALKATVWTDEGNNEGYYGLSLKKNEYKPKYISSTGKKVYKIQIDTNELIGTWDTIAKASQTEGVSTAKMSRYVKNKTSINDFFYSSIYSS